MKRILTLLMFIVLSVMLVACGGISGQDEETQDETIEAKAIDFSEIYLAYNENELRADDVYKDRRFIITAKVNGMETEGLLNMSGGATLTMEYQVGNTTVFFLAQFEKEQEDNLKTINIGDTIAFEGTCLSAGAWDTCELIE